MKSTRLALNLLVAFALCSGALTGTAHADPVKCRAAIAKSSAKFVQDKTKALQKCAESIVKRKLAPDPGPGGGDRLAFCLAEPKTSAKIDKSETKAKATIAKACGGKNKICDAADTGDDADDSPASIGWPTTCPDFENAGCNDPILHCGDIGTCVTCIGEAAVDQAISLYYDELDVNPDPANKDEKALNKCQQSIGKSAAKFLAAKSKVLQKCWDKFNKGKPSGLCPPFGAGDGKAQAAIAKAESKKIANICKACGGADKQCDDTVTGPNGTVINGSNGGDDRAVADIGFPASCTAVTVPDDGPACIGDGLVDTLAELVECVDCVTEFKVDCISLAQSRGFTNRPTGSVVVPAYPAECSPAQVNPGDPVLPPAAGYAGSETCSVCHPTKFSGWVGTAHRLPIRDTNEPGLTGEAIVADSDGDGTDDFKEAVNLGTAPNATAFAVYGVNAPVLGFDPVRTDPNSGALGVYTITIGAITYDITRTHGGNGYWKQRYQARVGDSYYYLPVQYNEATNQYSVYNGSDWYDGSNLPKYTNPATIETDINKAASYERKCAGCHNTGVDVQVDGAGQFVTGYVELGIGCEQCHGPGETHAVTMDPDDIVNPEELGQCEGDVTPDDGIKDGACRISGVACDAPPVPGAASADCLARANQVCGMCHVRGSSSLVLGGQTILYPAKDAGGGVFQGPRPGDAIADFYTLTTTASEYWGYLQVFAGVGSSVPSTPNSFVSSRGHHQQYQDLLIGPHAPNNWYDPTCFSCHDLHGSTNEHLIVDSLTEDGVDIPTQVDDNSLCLACHAGYGPFAAITHAQVAEIGTGTTPPEIQQAVLDHMAEEAGMGGAYDPLGSGVGQCTGCHLPLLSKSAVAPLDAEGHTTGDISSHVFSIIWPSVNERLTGGSEAMTNACTGCHASSVAVAGADLELFEWAKSGHADVTARHWRYAAGSTRTACVKCHSGYGFVDFLAGIAEADRRTDPKIHTCYTCHDGQPGDLHAVRAVASVTFPSGEVVAEGGNSKICMNCHGARNSKDGLDTYLVDRGQCANNPGSECDANADCPQVCVGGSNAGAPCTAASECPGGACGDTCNRISFQNPHYLPAAAMYFGTVVRGGYEYDGNTYTGRTPHQPFKGYCVDCHLSRSPGNDEVGGHTMAMHHGGQENTAGCGCHAAAAQVTLDKYRNPFAAAVDYDGDLDTTEGIEGEVQTLLDDLLTALAAAGITCTEAYPYCSGWNGTKAQQHSQLKAAYNYRFILAEPGAFAHNGLYALQLLHDSYEDLTGGAHAGTRP